MAHSPLPWFWSRHNTSPSLSTQQSQKLPICQFSTKYSTELDQNHQKPTGDFFREIMKSMEIPGTAANFVKTFSKKQRSSKVLRRSKSSRIKRPTMGSPCKISKYLDANSVINESFCCYNDGVLKEKKTSSFYGSRTWKPMTNLLCKMVNTSGKGKGERTGRRDGKTLPTKWWRDPLLTLKTCMYIQYHHSPFQQLQLLHMFAVCSP